MKTKRQVVLDIETTGMNKSGLIYKNHKIIEIGIVEIINRKITGKYFHQYLNPNRKIDYESYKIHGISNDFLLKKPVFLEVYSKILNFINNSEIIAHNASFDISFLEYEFSLLKIKNKKNTSFCSVIDTLEISRKIFPGKKNNLDALCNRYKIKNNDRKFHGALLDATLLAKIYLIMTGKQEEIIFSKKKINKINNVLSCKNNLYKIIYCTEEENNNHKEFLKSINFKKIDLIW